MLDVSIIIVSYNVREHLERCLSSIFNSTARRPAFEAIVIDNASSDRSPEMVRLDYLYVTGWSLWQDFVLIVRTIPVLLRRSEAPL